ncbi:peptidase inhibitor family I36 protein [Streptomyces bambusae]|uniref:peptidase inhibitor family I36 protein n=1 Tax=Streptomyces bambusae TaxID=1550616 RepID=UPI001CFDD092|nr:peptidase inhibitor family I36 protein [Streptomyces bambusae]MCB5167384.1 peptidase inhibitor family I36 protein [Streptomyces bambusae]
MLLATLITLSSTALAMPAAQASAQAYDCNSGYVCFYSDYNGTGSRCAWLVDDPDWKSGNIQCHAFSVPKSIYNMGIGGYPAHVAYYTDADYKNRKGCTAPGQRGNLSGTYSVRSHKWYWSC